MRQNRSFAMLVFVVILVIGGAFAYPRLRAADNIGAAAIGGIALASLPRVRETGATMAAVISALSGAADPEATARAFVTAWNKP